MYNRVLVAMLASLVWLVTGCSKTDDQPTDPGGETASAILIISGEPVGTGTVYSISVYEPSGAFRWKKELWGFVNTVKVDNGRLFVMGAPPNYEFGGKMGVYNLQTGAEIWSKLVAKEHYQQTIVRNDTLFVSENVQLTPTTMESFITTYNANTGAPYWKKKMGDSWYPFNMILRDSTIFCVVPTNPYPGGSLTSFNINTRTVNWSKPVQSVGSNVSIFSLSMQDDRLMMTGQNFNNYNWFSIDRLTGNTTGSITTKPMQGVLKFNNTLYGMSLYNSNDTENGPYAYDVNTGVKKWNTSVPVINGTPNGFTVSNSGLFFSNSGMASHYLRKYHVSNGSEAWTTYAPAEEVLKWPVTVGDRVYVQHIRFNGTAQIIKSKIFRYDVANGNITDSFDIPKTSDHIFQVISTSGNIYMTTVYQ